MRPIPYTTVVLLDRKDVFNTEVHKRTLDDVLDELTDQVLYMRSTLVIKRVLHIYLGFQKGLPPPPAQDASLLYQIIRSSGPRSTCVSNKIAAVM